MLYEDPHLSDRELLLAADGEVSRNRGKHLSACRECRTRMGEMEAAIAEAARLQHSGRDSKLPPANVARARLEARLAEIAAVPPRSRQPIYGWAALAAACLGIVILQFRSVDVAAAPRTSLTPGVTRPVTRQEVCSSEPVEPVRVIPASLRQRVFETYGMPNAQPRAYEVDYLITPELGGADDIRNLWPEPYSATVWNAHVKDALEDRLHQMVCTGQIDLATAQHDIATDWISAYKRYFHTEKPLSAHQR